MRLRLALALLCASSSLLAQDPRQRLLDDLIRREGTVEPSQETEAPRAPDACVTSEVVSNGGFEAGTTPDGCTGSSGAWRWDASDCILSPLFQSTGSGPRSGTWCIYPSPFPSVTAHVYQTIQIPKGTGSTVATLSFWVKIGTFEPSTAAARDFLRVRLFDTGMQFLTSLALFSNRDGLGSYAYVKKTYDVSQYAGRAVILSFFAEQDANANATLFLIDDVSLSVTACDTSTSGTCVPDANTACFLDGRFKATGTYNLESGATGALTFGPNLTTQSAPMYFENLADPQALVKVIPACFAPFNRYWVFIGALTNQGASLTVTDTARNVSKTYINSRGNVWSPIQDTNAFDTCP